MGNDAIVGIETKEEVGKPVRGKTNSAAPKWEAEVRARLKTALKRFQKPLLDLVSRDVNEADTRLLVTDFLCEALGFDKYTELSSEFRVKNEYVDYSLRIDKDIAAFVEIKRVNTKLGAKHLRQAQSYAVNEGVEWIFLTNGAEWQVYHLSGGLPIVTDLVLYVDLLADSSPQAKADAFFYLTKDAIKRGKLSELWEAKSATSPKSLASVLSSGPVLLAIRRELKRGTGYNVSIEEVSKLITETCLRPECFSR